MKFNYKGGAAVKSGAAGNFVITVSEETANHMTASGIQLEAKAATRQEIATLNCGFSSDHLCGPVTDANGSFAWTLLSAETNGDGTVTLTFLVQNFTNRGLSHVTIGLPDDANASICSL